MRPVTRPAPNLSFLSTLSLRRATLCDRRLARDIRDFYPRSPCGERPQPQQRRGRRLVISIHALLAESDGAFLLFFPNELQFLSTLSLRRATFCALPALRKVHNFYPRSPCGERRGSRRKRPAGSRISIHALLAESDIFNAYRAEPIHAFLSTLSLRRATVRPTGRPAYHTGFLSTLSLRRAT